MRVARPCLGILMVLLMVGSAVPGVSAQDTGVGFEDLPGLQAAISRTFTGNADLQSVPEPVAELRKATQPEVLLMLVAIFEFDTEANASAGYELLLTDMNATGIDGAPLPLTATELNLDLPHTAQVAQELRTPVPTDFTIVAALDGRYVYSVIGITRGIPPRTDIARIVRSVVASDVEPGPVSFSTDGTSTGGLWAKVPTREAIDRHYRGVLSVTDAAPFPL